MNASCCCYFPAPPRTRVAMLLAIGCSCVRQYMSCLTGQYTGILNWNHESWWWRMRGGLCVCAQPTTDWYCSRCCQYIIKNHQVHPNTPWPGWPSTAQWSESAIDVAGAWTQFSLPAKNIWRHIHRNESSREETPLASNHKPSSRNDLRPANNWATKMMLVKCPSQIL